MHILTAGALVAQWSSTAASTAGASVVLPQAGPDRPLLEAVRECPRYKCEISVELTVKGTRLRVGDTTRVSPLYLTGSAASRFLAVVPASRTEDRRGHRKLRERLLIGAATTAVTLFVFIPGFKDPSGGSFPSRTAAATVIAGTGIFFAGRRGRAAGPHFDEAVRLYNLELRP